MKVNFSNKMLAEKIEPNSKNKLSMNCEQYDIFLKNTKEGRFKRAGKWKGFSKSTLHECCDPECNRKWMQIPSRCLTDDYYCPSCVLHHRNNIGRFEIERLIWTASIPNNFYVYELFDPKSKCNLIKFGRTQHLNPDKRYSLQERKVYKMNLKYNLRGKLITMTKI